MFFLPIVSKMIDKPTFAIIQHCISRRAAVCARPSRSARPCSRAARPGRSSRSALRRRFTARIRPAQRAPKSLSASTMKRAMPFTPNTSQQCLCRRAPRSAATDSHSAKLTVFCEYFSCMTIMGSCSAGKPYCSCAGAEPVKATMRPLPCAQKRPCRCGRGALSTFIIR